MSDQQKVDDNAKNSPAYKLLSSADFINYLSKQGYDVCSLYKLKSEGKSISIDDTNEKNYIEQLSKGLNDSTSALYYQVQSLTTEAKTSAIQEGFRKANIWFLTTFITYIVIILAFIIFTFSLVVNIDNNGKETKQISKTIGSVYLTLGLSLIWLSAILFILMKWLVGSRTCGKLTVKLVYVLIAIVLLYTVFGLIALVDPIINSKNVKDNFFYSFTNIITIIMFSLLLLGLVIILVLYFKNRSKNKKDEKQKNDSNISSS